MELSVGGGVGGGGGTSKYLYLFYYGLPSRTLWDLSACFYYFLLPSPQVISAFIDAPFKKRGKGRWRFFLLFLPSFLFLLQ